MKKAVNGLKIAERSTNGINSNDSTVYNNDSSSGKIRKKEVTSWHQGGLVLVTLHLLIAVAFFSFRDINRVKADVVISADVRITNDIEF